MLDIKINFKNILKFVIPSIAMSVFMSSYITMDGILISKFLGSNALSATNIFLPLFSIVLAFSLMLAYGGSALISKLLGRGKFKIANLNFSMIIYFAILSSIIIAALTIYFINHLIVLLGATDEILAQTREYSIYLSLFFPSLILQFIFQTFFVVDGKPKYAMILTLIAGILNIVLDYIFMVPLNMGLKSASIATGIGGTFVTIFGFYHFTISKKRSLSITKPYFNLKYLLQTLSNGSSEMVSNLAYSVTTFLFNLAAIKYIGISGVAAISAILYMSYLINSIFYGYAIGISPLFSYNYGKENIENLKKLFSISVYSAISFSIFAFIFIKFFGNDIAGFFAGKNQEVFKITMRGLNLHSLSFLVIGLNILASSLFTSLSNGKISALLSLLRTFVFLSMLLIIFPKMFGETGIWISVPTSEFITIFLSVFIIIKYNKVYKYLK